jgi:hypothetical protein
MTPNPDAMKHRLCHGCFTQQAGNMNHQLGVGNQSLYVFGGITRPVLDRARNRQDKG